MVLLACTTGISPTSILWISVGVLLCYCIWYCIYSLYLHPLSCFPGPKRAAVWRFYEFYHDVIRDGRYLWQIEKMHQKYGPIVRINARELHIKDPYYYGKIYASGRRKVDKDVWTVAGFPATMAALTTVDHFHHRARRGYLNPYFSKRSVTAMVPMINERIDRLFKGFDNAMRTDKAIVLNKAFSSLAGDIVIQQLFGEHYDFVGHEDFESPVPALFKQFTDFYHLARFIPGLLSYLRRLPVPFIRLVSPSSPAAKIFYYRLRDKVDLLSKDTELQEAAPIISMLLNNTAIKDEERSPQRVFDEALIFVGAGAETLSRALRVGFFYLLNDKLILDRLRQELKTLPPPQEELYSLSKLEGLTYLSGVVHEALRLSFGPISRRPRIATEEILHYDTWAIPAGTPLSQSTLFMHTDPAVFPDPYSFKPERWIRDGEKDNHLAKYLTSFTKGSRQCIGMNVAFAELYLVFARIATTYDLNLHETTAEQISIRHDRVLGYPDKAWGGENKGHGEVKIKVVKKYNA